MSGENPSDQSQAVVRCWYLNQKGKATGPYAFADLKSMAAAGSLKGHDLVFKEGSQEWKRAYDWTELAKECFSDENRSSLSRLIKLPDEERGLDDQWVLLVREDGEKEVRFRQKGPFQAEEIKRMLVDEKIKASDHIWKKGAARWVPLYDVPEFKVHNLKLTQSADEALAQVESMPGLPQAADPFAALMPGIPDQVESKIEAKVEAKSEIKTEDAKESLREWARDLVKESDKTAAQNAVPATPELKAEVFAPEVTQPDIEIILDGDAMTDEPVFAAPDAELVASAAIEVSAPLASESSAPAASESSAPAAQENLMPPGPNVDEDSFVYDASTDEDYFNGSSVEIEINDLDGDVETIEVLSESSLTESTASPVFAAPVEPPAVVEEEAIPEEAEEPEEFVSAPAPVVAAALTPPVAKAMTAQQMVAQFLTKAPKPKAAVPPAPAPAGSAPPEATAAVKPDIKKAAAAKKVPPKAKSLPPSEYPYDFQPPKTMFSKAAPAFMVILVGLFGAGIWATINTDRSAFQNQAQNSHNNMLVNGLNAGPGGLPAAPVAKVAETIEATPQKPIASPTEVTLIPEAAPAGVVPTVVPAVVAAPEVVAPDLTKPAEAKPVAGVKPVVDPKLAKTAAVVPAKPVAEVKVAANPAADFDGRNPIVRTSGNFLEIMGPFRKGELLRIRIEGRAGQILDLPALVQKYEVRVGTDFYYRVSLSDARIPKGEYLVNVQFGMIKFNRGVGFGKDAQNFSSALNLHRKTISFEQQQERKRLIRASKDLSDLLTKAEGQAKNMNALKGVLRDLEKRTPREIKLVRTNRYELIFTEHWEKLAAQWERVQITLKDNPARNPASAAEFVKARKLATILESEVRAKSIWD